MGNNVSLTYSFVNENKIVLDIYIEVSITCILYYLQGFKKFLMQN